MTPNNWIWLMVMQLILQRHWVFGGRSFIQQSIDLIDNLLRNLDILAGVKLLESSQVHGLLQQRNDVRIESLPVRVLEVILLALYP
jgi:hypothetical protein